MANMPNTVVMQALTARERNALPDDAFALPGRRYPIPDKSHASNAIGRAEEMYDKGLLTKAERDRVVSKAKKVIDGE